MEEQGRTVRIAGADCAARRRGSHQAPGTLAAVAADYQAASLVEDEMRLVVE